MSKLVLGYFGYRTNQLDGQTVKTRDLFRLLKEHEGNTIDSFDTQEFQYKRTSVFRLLRKLAACRILFYLPAHNNLKYIFPVIFVLSRMFRFRILYFVVGGWLVEYLSNKPLHRWMLKRIDGIFTETLLMKDSLENRYGFANVILFTNFRFTSFVAREYHEDGKLKIVFLARINRMKGLDVVFYLADYILKNQLDDRVSIDFYGPIYQPDKDYFFGELKKYDFLAYKGELQPERINETIERYDVMLLPTHYYTEGLPGSVVDAYMSGIPIIVSQWKHAVEFVRDRETGFIIPFETGEDALCEKVELLLEDSELLREMKKKACEEGSRFASDNAWNVISQYID